MAMTTTIKPSGKRRRFARLLLAPAGILERARGRKRLVVAGAYCVIMAFIGVLIWRHTRLAGLPDIADPFDRGALLALSVPDERNAFVLYREASAKATRDLILERRLLGGSHSYPPATDKAGLAFLAANTDALAIWRRGCERPDALYMPIRGLVYDTPLPLLQDNRFFFHLAMIETSRLEAAGDMAGARGWYRAALRGSRLVGRHGVIIAWLIGCAEYSAAQAKIAAWAADPRVDAALLRRALDDVYEINAMTAPNSESLQCEYISGLGMMDHPDKLLKFLQADPGVAKDIDLRVWYRHLPGYWRARFFLEHEPERSRRIFKLMFANWLSQCEKPASDRLRMVGTSANPQLLYDVEPHPGALQPMEMITRTQSALFAKATFLDYAAAYGGVQRAYDRDRIQRARLVIALAEQLYVRKFGKRPASPDDLIGTCIDRFPDGYIKPVDLDDEPEPR
jgi:hypothetical protein